MNRVFSVKLGYLDRVDTGDTMRVNIKGQTYQGTVMQLTYDNNDPTQVYAELSNLNWVTSENV